MVDLLCLAGAALISSGVSPAVALSTSCQKGNNKELLVAVWCREGMEMGGGRFACVLNQALEKGSLSPDLIPDSWRHSRFLHGEQNSWRGELLLCHGLMGSFSNSYLK